MRNEWVILLHGMGRTKKSMQKMEKFLIDKGFRTYNPGYPSTNKTIEAIASFHVADAVKFCRKQKARKIHFVTHSLGGIIVRQYLQTHSLPPGSRIVMLAPPNQGSEVADWLKHFFLYQWLNGPAGQQLGTRATKLTMLLRVKAEIGVIAGNRSFNPLFSYIIPGPDDGKVGVAKARLTEMQDFTVVPYTHTFIMNKKKVQKQVLHFLKTGKFMH